MLYHQGSCPNCGKEREFTAAQNIYIRAKTKHPTDPEKKFQQGFAFGVCPSCYQVPADFAWREIKDCVIESERDFSPGSSNVRDLENCLWTHFRRKHEFHWTKIEVPV